MKELIKKVLREHNQSSHENISSKLIDVIKSYLKGGLNDDCVCRLEIRKNDKGPAFKQYDLLVDLGFKKNSDRYTTQKIINSVWDMCNNKFNISTFVDVNYHFNDDCEETHYDSFNFN